MIFVPFNLPSVPELPWTFKVFLTWSISVPPVSKILKPCYHGDILGSLKDVPELQWYNLIGLVSEYVLLSIDIWWQSRESRLQVSQRLQCDDKVHACVTDNNVRHKFSIREALQSLIWRPGKWQADSLYSFSLTTFQDLWSQPTNLLDCGRQHRQVNCWDKFPQAYQTCTDSTGGWIVQFASLWTLRARWDVCRSCNSAFMYSSVPHPEVTYSSVPHPEVTYSSVSHPEGYRQINWICDSQWETNHCTFSLVYKTTTTFLSTSSWTSCSKHRTEN